MDSLAPDRDDDRRARLLQIAKRDKRLRRRRAERVAAFVTPLVLAAALSFACFYGANAAARADGLERNVSELYRQSFYELVENVNDMQVALKKLMVVSSAQQHVLLLSDVWRLSGAASTNMAALPEAHTETMEANRFVIRAGDYAHALSRRILNGEILSEADSKQLESLYESSVVIAAELERRLESGELPVSVLSADGYYGDSGGTSEDAVSNYPTLIYDGPFSESTEKSEPRGLSGGEISAETAVTAAKQYLAGGELASAGEVNGAIPSYTVVGKDASEREVELAVTKRGGQVLWMMAASEGGEEGVPNETVTKKLADAAKAYLDARGYADMQPTYAQYYAGVAVLNFAATQDGVILYPDLVKVYVERKSAAVIGVDAYNYLFSHVKRELASPAIDEETARASISDALEIKATALALIPKTGSIETLCYEFKGTCRGADFIVYVNAVTGAEEEVYEIINSDEGQLVV